MDRSGFDLFVSIFIKRRTGLYGKLFDGPIAILGFDLVLFWVLVAIFTDAVTTFDPFTHLSGIKSKVPGTPISGIGDKHCLLGGDNLARDVFSRMVMGSRTGLTIAPTATLFTFMVGITLGVPVGYLSERLDTALSSLANLVLAFPAILLFYLLVTPEIRETGIPTVFGIVRSITMDIKHVTILSEAELRDLRGSKVAMIYQEPMVSLNPAMKIGAQLMEVPMIHESTSKVAARALALEVAEAVKRPDPERILKRYPHQLSDGQQQRIDIAMALMSEPSLLILDEPTTALDVTVDAGIIELVKELGEKYGTSMLFISHKLGLVLETCDRICVMYSDEAVETGSITAVFENMRHPYTQASFRSIPLPGADENTRLLVAISGNFPLLYERPHGCNFGPSCDCFEKV